MTTAGLLLTLHMIIGTELAPDVLKNPPLDGWFALCRDGKSKTADRLVPIELTFRRKSWPVAEGRTWSPRIKGCKSSVVLLRDLPWLGEREVTRAKSSRNEDKAKHTVRFAIALGTEHFSLVDRDIGTQNAEDHRVTLIAPSGKQHLQPFDSARDNPVEVIWSGDLDGDGKLDLLLRVPAHYAGPVHRLYLSSAAKGKDLLDWVAEQMDISC